MDASFADAVLLGLARLQDIDSPAPQLQAPRVETLNGLLAVAMMALGDMEVAGRASDESLGQVRATALAMKPSEFHMAAELLWASAFIEAAEGWPELYAQKGGEAFHHGDGVGGVAALLVLHASTAKGLTYAQQIDSYRAEAIEALAAA
jgi:hypothetical protein